MRLSVTCLCTERLCATALLRSAQTFEHVGQVTPSFAGTSPTISDVMNSRGLTVRFVHGDAARTACGAVHLVLSHPQELGLGNAVLSLLPRSNTMCVEETLHQSFISYEAVRTECPAAASAHRRCSGFSPPSLQDIQPTVAFAQGWCLLQRIRTKNERSANSRIYNLRVHKVCRVAGTLVECCPQRRKHS